MPEIPTISDKVKPPILRDSTNGKLIGIKYDKRVVKGDDRKRKKRNVITTERVKLMGVDLIIPFLKMVKLATPNSTPIYIIATDQTDPPHKSQIAKPG